MPGMGKNVRKTGPGKAVAVLAYAFVLWALCAASMGIGMAVTSEENALVIHAVGAPIIAFAVSSVYFRKLSYTGPLQTAIIFASFVLLVDFFVVALLILGELDMFASLLGLWIPLALILFTTYLNGVYVNKHKGRAVA